MLTMTTTLLAGLWSSTPAPIPTRERVPEAATGGAVRPSGPKTDDWGLAGGVANEPWPVPPCL